MWPAEPNLLPTPRLEDIKNQKIQSGQVLRLFSRGGKKFSRGVGARTYFLPEKQKRCYFSPKKSKNILFWPARGRHNPPFAPPARRPCNLLPILQSKFKLLILLFGLKFNQIFKRNFRLDVQFYREKGTFRHHLEIETKASACECVCQCVCVCVHV